MAIADLTFYKAYRGVTDTDTARDAKWTQMLTSAQSMLEQFCDRSFDTGTYTERISGDGTPVLTIKNAPLTAITSITIYANDGTTSTVDSGDYRGDLDGTTGIIYRLGSKSGRWSVDDFGFVETSVIGTFPNWPEGDKNISVVYTGGYSSGTMPTSLKQLVCEMVDSMSAGAGRDNSLQSESIGPYSYTRAGASASGGTLGGMPLTWWQLRAMTYRRGSAL